MIRGDNIRDISKAVAEKLGSSLKNAERVVRTETSHIHNTAEIEAYKAAGYEEYEFMASFGERTCPTCGGTDGKLFKLSDKADGLNFPPLHPNCRCTTIAFDPDDDLEDMKSGELDYEQWYKKYVEGREQPKLESKGGAAVELPKLPASSAPMIAPPVEIDAEVLTTGVGSGIIPLRGLDPIPQNQVVNIMRQESDAWINQLTAEELRAVKKYTKNSGDKSRPFFYERLNSMLRGAIPEDDKLRYYTDTISSALTKNTLKYDILWYRRSSKVFCVV